MTKDITARDFNPSNNEIVDAIKAAVNTAGEAIRLTPDGRRKQRALDKLEEASMIAVKGVFYNDNNDYIG
jgi:hypothetical protein